MKINRFVLISAAAALAACLPATALASTGEPTSAEGSLAAFIPNDPGDTHTTGDWQKLQWNFLAPVGIDAPDAWQTAISRKAAGGKGVTVAVVDTGVAYMNRGRFRKSPDLKRSTFIKGYDFVDGDRYPLDENGHGTHVASTIAENTDNRYALTGIAYGVKIIPVRVLDNAGIGSQSDIAAGVIYAAKQDAEVINLSVQFDPALGIENIPQIVKAVNYAVRKGATVVAASGNFYADRSSLPARIKKVVSVGATTEHLCLADYSDERPDLVAPGGGSDRVLPVADPQCKPEPGGRSIYQVTFRNSARSFGIHAEVGTSMAAAHVSAVAALAIATGAAGKNPSPHRVERWLTSRVRDLGPAGTDRYYGAGLLDANLATTK